MKKIIGIFVCMLLVGTVFPISGQVIKKSFFIENDENNPLINGDKWRKTFGDFGYDCGFSVLQTIDGGYIVAGRSYSHGDLTDWIIKTDSKGNMIWNKNYTRGSATSIKQTNDGGYIILGQIWSKIDGSTTSSLIKIDSNGNMIWNKTFNKKFLEYGYDVIQTDDGSYILTGSTSTWMEMGLIKLDYTGNEIWNKTYNGIGTSVKQTDDGGYIIGGTKNLDMLLLKTDGNGEVLWSKTFGGNYIDWGNSLEITNDGGYIIAGIKGGKTSSMGDDAWVIKTDSNGDHLWNKTYGRQGGDIAYSIQQTSDGGYIIAGNSYKLLYPDGMLIKTNSDGDEEWVKYIGGFRYGEFHCVRQTSDDGYIITGGSATRWSGFWDIDVWLIKTDENGNAPKPYNKDMIKQRMFSSFPVLFRILQIFNLGK